MDKSVVARRSRFVRKDDWTANWVWCEGDSRPRNFYLHARKAFKLPARPVDAKLRISADSRYKLFINGVFVGRGPVRSDPHRQSYDIYNIADFLVKGQNVIAVLVHHIGQGTYSYIPGRPGLICEADIEWEGASEKIITDETWRVLPASEWTAAGTRMSRRLGWQEVYDANLEPQNWTKVKFKDAKWPQAIVLGKSQMRPFYKLVPREIPHLREQLVYPDSVYSIYNCPPLPEGIQPPDMPAFMAEEDLKPLKKGRVFKPERLISANDDAAAITVPNPEGISLVLDFGREVFGSIELEFTRSNGGIVDIGYSEVLQDGKVIPNRGDIRYTDRLILRNGKQTWTSFEQRAFRYVQLDLRNCPKPVSISHVRVHETSYPVEWQGNFECSDEELNRIWRTAAETARLSMQDTYTDSPWRERTQWWDNASVASRAAYYAFGDTKLMKQGLRHIAASQEGDGAIFAMFPSATRELFPDFAALWVMSLWEYYAQSEDLSLLAELYPNVVKWLKWIGQFTDSDGLLSRVRGDLFIDWAEIDRRGEVAALNCLYLGALRAACWIAEALHKRNEAEEWAGMASALRMAISKFFWSRDHGLFADARVDGKLQEHYSRQTNILAALFDVADHYQKSSIFRQMLDEKGLPPISTPYFTSYLVEALSRSGFAAQAVDVIKEKWGKMLSEGATTFWEHFNPENGDCRCYAASSGPAYQLPAHVLGIKPTGEPKRVRIEPHPSGLEWAKGTVQTASGPVSVEWQTVRRGLTLLISVPSGVIAEFIPPKGPAPCRVLVDGRDRYDSNIELGGGKHTIQLILGAACKPQRRKANKESTQPEPLPIPPGRGDIETVEQMIKILAELEHEFAERAAKEELEKLAQQAEKKRKRGRRSKRSHTEAAETQEAQKSQPAEGEAVETIEASPTTAANETETSAASSSKKQRRHRTKSKGANIPEEQPVKPEEVEAEIAASPKAEAVSDEPSAERKRTSRRHQRRSVKQAPDVVETAQEQAIAAEPTPAEEPPVKAEEPVMEEKKPKRRSRKASPVVEETATAAVEPAPVVVEDTVSTAEPEVKQKRRGRRASKTSKEPAETPEPVVVSEPVAEPVVEPVQQIAPDSDNGNGKKPRRRYTSRRKTAPKQNTVEKKETAETSAEN